MNLTATIKQKTLRLIGLMLIAIPLIASYTILRVLGSSTKIASIAAICLSGIAYFLLVLYIEPFLRQKLPFIQSKAPNEFSAAILKRRSMGIQILKGPSSSLSTNELDASFFNANIVRDIRGNWIHS